MPSADDCAWMKRALALAARGRGAVEPNPLVGAVVVREGTVVGEGWHARFGGPHAEVAALEAAGGHARGATLFVTLEPCCHQGKTPPCTDAILRSGICRVVAAMRDPFPEVAGKGIAQLCQAGIEVEVGLGEAEARTLNAPYLKLLATGRPYVHAKWAMSLDGKIATRVGDSKWISGASARNRGHELRGRMDAIVVGIGTVLADDPLLTARPAGPRTATRVVLDSRGRLPFDSQLVRSVADAPVLVAIAEENASTDALVRRGCEILVTPSERGQVSIPALLDELGRRRMTNILVEGGGQVLGGFLDLHAIDEVHAFIAPVLVGGGHAPSPVAGVGSARLAEAIHLTSPTVELLDDDLYVAARLPPWGDPG